MVDEALLDLRILDGGEDLADPLRTLIERVEREVFRPAEEVHVLADHQVLEQEVRAEGRIGDIDDGLVGAVLLEEHIAEVAHHLEEEVALHITLAGDEILEALDLVVDVLLAAEDGELLLLVAHRRRAQEIRIGLVDTEVEEGIGHQLLLRLGEPAGPLARSEDGGDDLRLQLLEVDLPVEAPHEGHQGPGDVLSHLLGEALAWQDALEHPDMAAVKGLEALEGHGGREA